MQLWGDGFFAAEFASSVILSLWWVYQNLESNDKEEYMPQLTSQTGGATEASEQNQRPLVTPSHQQTCQTDTDAAVQRQTLFVK